MPCPARRTPPGPVRSSHPFYPALAAPSFTIFPDPREPRLRPPTAAPTTPGPADYHTETYSSRSVAARPPPTPRSACAAPLCSGSAPKVSLFPPLATPFLAPCRHARPPAFSMGRRVASPHRDEQPGPGDYDPFTRAPAKGGPAASVLGRPLSPRQDQLPGPSDYATSPGADGFRCCGFLFFRFLPPLEDVPPPPAQPRPRFPPSPGIRATRERRNPSAFLAGPHRVVQEDERPGPNAYSGSPGATRKKAPSFSLGASCTTTIGPSILPAPHPFAPHVNTTRPSLLRQAAGERRGRRRQSPGQPPIVRNAASLRGTSVRRPPTSLPEQRNRNATVGHSLDSKAHAPSRRRGSFLGEGG